jgi:hypothetical protein
MGVARNRQDEEPQQYGISMSRRSRWDPAGR